MKTTSLGTIYDTQQLISSPKLYSCNGEVLFSVSTVLFGKYKLINKAFQTKLR